MKIEKYIQRLQEDKIVIFLFHGVIKSNPFSIRNYNRKHILEDEFYNLLINLKAYGAPVSMNDLIEKKELPSRSFIITFDDGFENNYSVAAPILDFLKIPAIFYLTSSFIDKNLMSWIDQIDHAIQSTGKKDIKLSFFKNSISISNDEEKKNLLIAIREHSKKDKYFFLKKEYYIKEIFNCCEVSECSSQNNSIDLKMNWKQVVELSRNDFFTMGGHTHTHPIMSYLPKMELGNEIEICLNYLRNVGIHDLTHFSYPEGLAHCYNAEVIQMLKRYNIQCCPTAIDGVNEFNTDLFHLKRVTVV